jgi:hypothetical protein
LLAGQKLFNAIDSIIPFFTLVLFDINDTLAGIAACIQVPVLCLPDKLGQN